MASSLGRARAPLAILVVTFLLPAAIGAQGFGVFKKTVKLSRSLPPVIDLSGTRVGVSVVGVPGRPQMVTQLLRAKIIPLVFSNGTLVEAQANPDRVIEVTITDFTTNTRYDTDRSQVVTATIKAAYRTINFQTRQSLDAKNLGFEYERRFPPPAQPQPAAKPSSTSGKGFLGKLNKLSTTLGSNAVPVETADVPPTADRLTTLMVEALAVQVAQRVVLTKESIEVPLPRSRLDKASDLAVAGRWGAMLEQLEQTAPLPGADDAYRIYGIGVANEALAYLEEDPAKQRDLVANAAQSFKDALRLHPDEGTLQKAENRIVQSVAALTVAAAQQSRSDASQRATVARAADTKTRATRWDNASVIELVKAGFKDAELVDAIRAAPSPEFEVASPAGLLELRRAGVSDVVIRAMRMRMGGSESR
jgi:hypothetical protein